LFWFHTFLLFLFCNTARHLVGYSEIICHLGIRSHVWRCRCSRLVTPDKSPLG
jgi:hypothetical protein